jgi:flagellar biosynthesis protein FlhA
MASTMNNGGASSDRVKQMTDWLLGFGVLGLLLTLVAPLPPVALDLLLALNLSSAILILMTTMHVQ